VNQVSYQQNRKRVKRPAGWRVKLPGNITVIKDVEYDRVLHNGEIVAKCSNLTGIRSGNPEYFKYIPKG
jgi:hypothetical protein